MTAILVAEDDPGICDLLTEVLETELSARVRCERTGSLALQAIETAGFDLAIIDVNMPEISGYELARRAANRNIPTLLSSGHPDSDIRLKEYECPYLASCVYSSTFRLFTPAVGRIQSRNCQGPAPV
jgi:CheY-like chemotaxis protein